MTESDSPLDFPCDIPVKIFGRNDDDFRHAVRQIVARHFPEAIDDDPLERLSRRDRYVSLTVSVWAESREQIDALYRDLTAHELVLMAL